MIDGVSARNPFSPWKIGTPSAPMLVVTTGRPMAIASSSLPRRPEPVRTGLMNTLARARAGRTSSTLGRISMRGSRVDRWYMSGVGSRPTKVTRNWGRRWESSGHTCWVNQRKASRFCSPV